MEKLRLPLEIGAYAVAIALGCIALWNQFAPSRDLTAELLITEARPPAELLGLLATLPQRVEEDLVKDKEVSHLLVPDEKTRKQAIEVVKDTVYRHSSSVIGLQNRFMFVHLRNEGRQPLQNVTLSFRHPLPYSATVVKADGSTADLKVTGAISLGHLPPRAGIKVFAWGTMFHVSDYDDITVSHDGGVGEIRVYTVVPEFVWANHGIFLSFQHTLYALLAIPFVVMGIWLAKQRSRTKRGP